MATINLDKINRKLRVREAAYPQYDGTYTLFGDQVATVEGLLSNAEEAEDNVMSWLDENGNDLLEVFKAVD